MHLSSLYRNIVAVAVLAIAAPSATIIAAQSYAGYIAPAEYIAQQEPGTTTTTEPHAPDPVLAPNPMMPSGQPICPAMPEFPCPDGMENIVEQHPNGCPLSKCVQKSGNTPPMMDQRGEPRSQLNDEGRGAPPGPNMMGNPGTMSGPGDQQFRGEDMRRGPDSGSMMPPRDDRGGDMRGGPSDEDRERMEREQKARMLKDMQRNIRGMEQGLTMMSRGLRTCTVAKIPVAAEVTAGIERMKGMVATVKSAKDPEAIEDLDFSEFAEIGDLVREQVDLCHRLREFPRITKQINRELARIEREAKRVTAQATRARIDLTEQLQVLREGVMQARATLTEIANARTSEAVETAMEELDAFRDRFDDLQRTLDTVRRVVYIRQGITEAKREIRNAERQIASMKRRKVDTAELEALLAEGKQLVATIESLAKQKPLDIEALVETFDRLEDLGDRADDAFAVFSGKAPAPNGTQVRRSPAEDLKLDVFDQFRKPKEQLAPEPQETPGIEGTLPF